MKQIILVSFILLLIGNNIFAQSESYYPKYHNIKKKYKVMDIKQINKAYLVSVVDDDYYKFTIVSLKTKEKVKIKSKKEKNMIFYFTLFILSLKKTLY